MLQNWWQLDVFGCSILDVGSEFSCVPNPEAVAIDSLYLMKGAVDAGKLICALENGFSFVKDIHSIHSFYDDNLAILERMLSAF